MKHVVLLQHSAYAEPGYVTQYLDQHDIPWRLLRIDEGAAVPDDPAPYAGLCFLGGSMSVNDPLPWIEQALALIRNADRLGVPIVGHCFGSQLLAKAFGATVTRNPVKEIGWGWMEVLDSRSSDDWLGVRAGRVRSFQWHGDTFTVPEGADLLMESEFCAHQTYVIRDLHLGMQSHLEMTPELVRKLTIKGAAEIDREIGLRGPAAVQTAAQMLDDVDNKCAEVNALMARMYDRWRLKLRR
jgi:GMP synthase-like glutamine amidotransferase